MLEKIPVGPIPVILMIYHIIKTTKKRGLMNEKILTPAEVAERLQISMAKAYSLLKNGEIDVVRIGDLVRVKDEDLERYIEARTQVRGPAR
jgi:excisionase family DNA binding protein